MGVQRGHRYNRQALRVSRVGMQCQWMWAFVLIRNIRAQDQEYGHMEYDTVLRRICFSALGQPYDKLVI